MAVELAKHDVGVAFAIQRKTRVVQTPGAVKAGAQTAAVEADGGCRQLFTGGAGELAKLREALVEMGVTRCRCRN